MSTGLAASFLRVLRHLRLRHAAWVALGAACTSAVACSNSNPQPADGFVLATMGISKVPGLCSFSSTTPWVDVGTATGGKPTTVQNGSQEEGATVHVNCSVSAVGQGFDVLVSVTQDGLEGGSVTFGSAPGQGAITASGGTLQGSFGSGRYGDYDDANCMLTYTYQGTTVPDSPPIAAGRIWGHVSCPNAQISGQLGTGADGGSTEKTCDGEADILFEQCGN